MRINDLLGEDVDSYDLQAKYDHFNALLFGNSLPKIPIVWGKMKSVGGVVDFKVVRSAKDAPTPMQIRLGLRSKYHGARLKPDSIVMKISTVFKRSERELDGILVHEMIHVHFINTGDYVEHHGAKFLRMRRDLQTKVDFTIPLTDDVSNAELNSEKTKPVGVVMLKKSDGRHSVALLSPEKLRKELNEHITRWEHFVEYSYVESVGFYVVDNAIWTTLAARLPIQRVAPAKLRFAFIDDEALAALQTGEKLASVPA